MKFAALVLLLAVGSQAASLQADAPAHFTQAREKFRETATRVLAPLDQTAYKEQAKHAVEMVDQRLGQAIEMGHSAYGAAYEATAGIRETLMTDVQKLQTELVDDAEKARVNILEHVQEYLAALTPLKTHLEGKRADIEELKEKVKTAVESIGEKVPGNWEETKGTLTPIFTKVMDNVKLRAAEAKEKIDPYLNEYLESFQAAMQTDKTTALAEAKAKISAAFSTMIESLGN